VCLRFIASSAGSSTRRSSAITHFLGGKEKVLGAVAIRGSSGALGCQTMRLAGPGVAFKVTALESNLRHFEENSRRVLRHADLRAILWINISPTGSVTLVTIE